MTSKPVDPRLAMRMEIAKPGKVGPETIPAFWNPSRYGVKLAPEDFREKLHALDETLEATWNPEIERWQVFCKSHLVNHPLSRGWRLLFIVKDLDGSYVPLDERTLAKCYLMSGHKWANGVQYFDAVVRETKREQEAREKRDEDEQNYKASEYWDYAYKPKVGYGAISPSKVVGQ